MTETLLDKRQEHRRKKGQCPACGNEYTHSTQSEIGLFTLGELDNSACFATRGQALEVYFHAENPMADDDLSLGYDDDE